MKPDKLTVHELFQPACRYVVPLYQRPYVWTREVQWEPLWEDIARQAELCVESEVTTVRSHFLGAIVTTLPKIVGGGVARRELIDGQQRLTTLQLFIVALRDYVVAVGSPHADTLWRLTTNVDAAAEADASFKVWPTNADRALFRTVTTAGSVAALKTTLGLKNDGDLPRMAAGYVYFSQQLRGFIEQAKSRSGKEERIAALVETLRTPLQLVVIELEEGDDPQVIFETLNARGQPLLPSDLIRNFLFLQAEDDSDFDPDTLYDWYWRQFDETRLTTGIAGEDRFWHYPERLGRLTKPRIDLFIYDYLAMKTGSDVNLSSLFREFREWRDTELLGTEPLLADLKEHSEIFSRLIAPMGIDRVSVFARRLKALDNRTIFPLLLFLLSVPPGQLSKVERDQILGDLESWLVRRFICQLTAKGYNRFFVRLLAMLKEAVSEGVPLPDLVRNELRRSSEPTLVWPKDDQFGAAWVSYPLYNRNRPTASAMILLAIEDQVREAAGDRPTLDRDLVVAHLLPRAGSLKDYPYPKLMPLTSREGPDRCRARLVDTIGNLTLLTHDLSLAIANGPFGMKAKAIAAHGDFRLNAWLSGNRATVWSEVEIQERGRELFKAAVSIWPRAAAETVSDQRLLATAEAWDASDF